MKFNARYTQNTLGDVNLIQIAAGIDTESEVTVEQDAALKLGTSTATGNGVVTVTVAVPED